MGSIYPMIQLFITTRIHWTCSENFPAAARKRRVSFDKL